MGFSRLDLLLLLMVGIWGANFSAIKLALRDFPEASFNAMRLVLAAAVFLVAILRLEPPSTLTRRDWATLGPKLRGKLHVNCGDMDNYYLNNGVYLMEEFLRKADPPADAVVDYGDRAEHCWNGDHENPIWISRLRYNTMYVPKILKRMEATAPQGADLKSWRH